MQTIITGLALEHVVLPIVSFVVTALLGWAAQRFHAWTGYQIEARHREALQSALENGVRFALQRLLASHPNANPLDLVREDREAVLSAAESYVRKSVPDALGHFGLDRRTQTLRDLITTKLPVFQGFDLGLTSAGG